MLRKRNLRSFRVHVYDPKKLARKGHVNNSLERTNFGFYLWMSQLHLDAEHPFTRTICLSIKEPGRTPFPSKEAAFPVTAGLTDRPRSLHPASMHPSMVLSISARER